jgi:Flp pilus assembly protein TadG
MTVGPVRPRRAMGMAMGIGNWIGGMARGLAAFTRRFAGDTRGNVAMIFALTMPVLILMTVGGVDIHRASTVRVNLQDALDAAALAAARSPYETDTEIQRVGMAALNANLKAYPNIDLREADTTFRLVDEVVIARSKVDVKAIVANIFLPPYGKFMDDYIVVGAGAEVDRSSRNVEVALVLDLTDSMDQNNRLSDMKEAARDLVDLIVQDTQTPYYSKVALVPYSNSVNPGSYLNSVRGSTTGSVNITGAVINFTGTAKTITAATKARPVVITSANHGFVNGDVVWITAAGGMTQLNNKAYKVTNKTTNTFELYTLGGSRVDGTNYSTYSGTAGRVQKCQNNDCSVTITASNHGLSNNQYVHITGVGGMTQINNGTYLVGNATTNTYTVDPDLTALTPYTSGGKSWCAQAGCTWFAFENVNQDLTANITSSCVTERTGASAYTDNAPTSSARVGRQYPDTTGNCLGSSIYPLSASASTLKSRITNFDTTGSTAGQIGIAWGWYMLSPNFNTIWPSSPAGDYNPSDTLKAMVIMTDGEFNTSYCNAVPASDAAVFDDQYRNNCLANNGDPFDQSERLCDAIKAQGIVIYTVGFQITAGTEAAEVLEDCATTPENFYLPSSGGDLSEAFAAIGRDIVQLRISK